jgi:hypothetical protein
MEPAEEMMHQIGAFEPFEAKRVLAVLETHQIPYDAVADNSALSDPFRSAQLYFGMYPEGSKLAVFVPESMHKAAMEVLKELFPV